MAVPAKILLKSSTKMSLNERFSKLPTPPSTEAVRASAAADTQSAARNRRLALQMENRPAVKAALGHQPQHVSYVPPPVQPERTMPIMHQPAQMRLSAQPTQRLGVQQQRIPVQQRITPQQVPLQQRLGKPNVRSRLSLPQRPIARGNFAQRGMARGRGYLGYVQQQRGGRGMAGQQRGVGRGGVAFGSRRGGNATTRGGFNKFRGARGGMTRGNRGRGRGGSVSVEALDNQLDEYMSKTRTHLDAELDAYMAESND